MKIGLAISGGANKGSWAEGVVTAIENKHGPEFELIGGTSIGGVVGACQATGMHWTDRWQWWESMTWGKVTNPRFPPIFTGLLGSSFYSNAKMKKHFKALFPRTFEELKIPLALTACNLMADLTEDANVVIRSGDLHQALLATVAIPGIFPPVEKGEMLLVDGGIGNYVPLEIFRGFDRVYCILCGYGVPPEKPDTALKIISRSFEMSVQEEIIREIDSFKSEGTKIRVIVNRRPEIVQSSMMDWLHGREWLRMGYEDGVAALAAETI